MTRNAIPSIRELRTITQSAKAHRNEWHYRIHRKISIYVTWVLLHTPLTANQVSLLGFTQGLLGASLVLSGDSRWALLGMVCFYGYFLFDKVDGEIARYREQQSLRGVCLDYVGHLAIPPLVPLSVGGFIAGQAGSSLFWLAGSAAALSVMFTRVARDLPFSIFLRKSQAESALFESVAVPAEERPASNPPRRIAYAVRWLINFWPSLVLLTFALSAFTVRPSLRTLLDGTFLVLCFLHLANAGVAAIQTVRNIEGRVARFLQRMDRA